MLRSHTYTAELVGLLCAIATPVIGGQTELGIDGTRFTINGKPAFLLGISYYGGAAAPADTVRQDLDDLAARHINWVRVWATWASGDENTSAVTASGEPRQPYFDQLAELVRLADERGIVVDVTLTRGPLGSRPADEALTNVEDHCRAAQALAAALRGFGNVYIDMANERDVRDARFVPYEELAAIKQAIREADPGRLVTASGVDDGSAKHLRGHLEVAGTDFICPHRPRGPESPGQTEEETRRYLATMREIGRVVPVHYQEPFRRGYGHYEPVADDFLTDLAGAVRGGAAGWCLHNGSPRDGATGPMRSFDLRPGQPRLMEQLDEVELDVLSRMASTAAAGRQEDQPMRRNTEVSIRGDAFYINGRPTYEGRTWQGHRVEGLLLNSRMVQGIFDDLNAETRGLFAYPDTGVFDAERNTREFVTAMPDWRRHGLLAFTINLQGGMPRAGASDQPWHNSALTETGELRPDYMARLESILDRADELGMVVILGVFYFGQDQRLADEAAVVRGLDSAVDWVLDRGYRNVLIEVNNECDVQYDHAILQPPRVHELIERAKSRERDGRRLLVSASYGGGTIPAENVVGAADFVLLHGNGVGDPAHIAEMVRATRRVPGYHPMPIVFNEDDHYDFDKPTNNMAAAIGEYASWGYYDQGATDYTSGYQSPPVSWRINPGRNRAFFDKVKEITGP